MSDRNTDGRKADPLDAALASLERDVAPGRDLWPQIRAEIEQTPIMTDSAPVIFRPGSRWLQVAAGVLLVFATSLTTYYITRNSMQGDAQQIAQQQLPAPQLDAVPVSFGSITLGADYMAARAELDKLFAQRLATLPPATRAKIERNLADLRHAAGEISKTLAEHPSDPLLQQLLMSTYQSELQLLADVNQITSSTSTRTDL